MGEALLVRKGGGAKVTIDGEKVKGNMNLRKVYSDIPMSNLPFNYQGEVVVLNGELHIMNSCDDNGKHYKWNGNEWTLVSTLPAAEYAERFVVCDNEIYMLGVKYKKFYKWNGSEWTSVGTLPSTYFTGQPVVYNNEIHVVGGTYGGVYSDTVYKWNGSEWTQVSTTPYGFWGKAVALNNEIYIFDIYVGNKECYKWNMNSWEKVGSIYYSLAGLYPLAYGNEIHMLGGRDSDYAKQHYAFHIETYREV